MSHPVASTARNIIAAFGGISRMAAILRYPKSTVQRWSDSNFIHSRHYPEILRCAVANAVKLDLKDFLAVDPAHPAFGFDVSAPCSLAPDDKGAHAAASSPYPIPDTAQSQPASESPRRASVCEAEG